jgi:ankyrin repeat protein
MAEIESRDVDETTPLIRATKIGNYGSVQTLLEWPTTKPNLKDETNMTSLLWAAKEGHFRIVKRLLQTKGIDANSQDNEGRTPLC